MSQIRYQDRVFELVEKFTFAEIDYIEKIVGQPVDEWSSTTSVRATLLLSIRRADPKFLTWRGLGELGLDDFTFLDDDGDEIGTETPDDGEAAPLDEAQLAIAAGLPVGGDDESPEAVSDQPATND